MVCTSAFAQPGGGGRGRGGFGGGFGPQSTLSLAGNAAVQKELEATEDQVTKLKALGEEVRAAMMAEGGGFGGGADLRDLPEAERRAKMEEMVAKRAETARKVNEKFKPELAKILDAKQSERLEQIFVQAAGVQAYSDPTIAKALKISKEQEETIASINKEFTAKQRELFTGGGGGGDMTERFAKMRELNTARDKDLEDVLTPDQKSQLAKMKGKEFDVAQLRGGRPGGGGGGRPGAGGRPQRQPQ
ncbi:MAG: hypothetical protein JSS49_15745 [Planctomycetes bacterium]|nr:hypothetical protein [Planctomycetota bacterium]